MKTVRLPTPLSELTDIKRRLYDLERRLRGLSGSTRPDVLSETIVFSQGGDTTAVTTTEVSGRYYPRRRSTLGFLLVSLTTSGSSTTTVSVKKNGVEITTVSLGSAVTLATKAVTTSFSLGVDYLTVAASAAGTNAEGLTVQAEFV